jgi:hypothetical protein
MTLLELKELTEKLIAEDNDPNSLIYVFDGEKKHRSAISVVEIRGANRKAFIFMPRDFLDQFEDNLKNGGYVEEYLQ